jgi:hypothetical protein
MGIQIRPPEWVAFTPQVLHAYKVDEQAQGTQISAAPTSREFAHASGPLTVYIEVPVQNIDRWVEMLGAIGYWGQASSLVYCTRVYQEAPDPKECVTPLRNWNSHRPLELFFTSFLSEFRAETLSWDDVMPAVGAQKTEVLQMDMYVWPMVMLEQHGGGRLLKRRAFA